MAQDLLRGLNGAQRTAVSSPANTLQVLAPPGSGKTKTLTARVAYHIAHDGFHPRNIIVCTFTLKATREMRERLENLLGKDVAKQLVLGTFHSVARRFLVSYGKEIGLDPKFGIADTSDSNSIIKRIIENAKGTLTIDPRVARNRISKLKAQGVSPEQHQAASARQLSKGTNAANDIHELTTTYYLYEEHLRINNLLDYDDLLLRCAELLRRLPSCVKHVRAVLIDEFQDTNHVQFDLMTLFSQSCNKISTVGDPDQSIYGWRSADVTNLKRMREAYPELHVVNLEENYRSSGLILLRAQEVIEQDLSRPEKALTPTHGPGLCPVLRTLKNAFWEAHWLVLELQRFTSLSAGLLNWGDFAILLRSASLSRLIEQALAKNGVPYRMVGGLRFFDRVEVKIILDYLRVIAHPQHTDALVRVLNVPSRGIGEKTMQGLLDEATEKKMNLWDLVLGIGQHRLAPATDVSSQARKGMTMFIDTLIKARQRLYDQARNRQTLPEFIKYVLEKIDLRGYIKTKFKDEEESRWANVLELITLAVEAEGQDVDEDRLDFEAEQPDSNLNDEELSADIADQDGEQGPGPSLEARLSHFLSTVALSTDTNKAAEEAEEAGEVQRSGQVNISTIHAAKGLEWPVVFVPGCYEGSLPHSRAEDADEERRLLYVAMTRAQGMLYLSRPHLGRADQQGSSGGPTTELTHFITGEMVERYARKGPSILTQDVHELSLILRRNCPSATAIAAARSSMEQILDNQHPEDPAAADETERDYEPPEYGTGFARKRKAIDESGAKRPFEGFKSVTTAFGGQALSTDFATVRSTTTICKADVVSKFHEASSMSSRSEAGSTQKPAKRGRLDVGQKSISSFFRPPQAAVEPKETALSNEVAAETMRQSLTGSGRPLQPLANPSIRAGTLARSSSESALEASTKPGQKRSLIPNPASRGRALTEMTRTSTLGIVPAQPRLKRSLQPGALSRAGRE